MSQDKSQLAREIIDLMGGRENIINVSHCYTRLRLTARDDSLVNTQAIKERPGVLGLINRGSDYQIVIGNEVAEFFETFIKVGDFHSDEVKASEPQKEPDDDKPQGEKKKQKNKTFTWILDFIAGTFSPVIPVLIAGGLTGAVLTVLVQFFHVSVESGTYSVFYAIQNSAFYFLPVFIGFSAARKLNIDGWLGAFLGAILLHGNIDGVTGLKLFGIPVTPVVYNTTVFPILLGVLFMSVVYKFFQRILPKEIKSIFLPLLTMIVTVPVTLIALGPIGGIIGNLLSVALSWLYEQAGPLAVMIMGAANPFLVFFGMNNALYPLVFALHSDLGFDPLICTGMLAANIAVGGACLAYAIRTRESQKKAIAVSGGITGLLGITEPAVYGVLFPDRKPLWAAVIGGAVGGLLAGILDLAAYAVTSPSFASLVMFIPSAGSAQTINNFYNAIIVALVSLFVSFTAGLLIGVPKKSKDPEKVSNV